MERTQPAPAAWHLRLRRLPHRHARHWRCWRLLALLADVSRNSRRQSVRGSRRLLQIADDSPNAAPVAVLNYGFWRSRFGGSQDVIGRTIDLNSVAFTVVGVAEQRFTGIAPGSDFDVWLPLSVGPQITKPATMWQNRQDDPGIWWLTVLGRLKPGVPVAQVQTAVSGIFANAMLHGAVPLFDLGAGALGSIAPSPAPGPVRSQVSISGPGPLPPPAPSAGVGGASVSANAATSRKTEITSSRANAPQPPA